MSTVGLISFKNILNFFSVNDNGVNIIPSSPLYFKSSSSLPRKWHSLTEIYEQTKRCQLASTQELSCFEDAIQIEEWCATMDEEIKPLKKHDTWELVDLPNGIQLFKWV